MADEEGYDRARDLPMLKGLIGKKLSDIIGPFNDDPQDGDCIQLVFEDATVIEIPAPKDGSRVISVEVQGDED